MKSNFCGIIVFFTDRTTNVNAETLLTIEEVSLSSKNEANELSRITPGSEVLLNLVVFSHFPTDMPLDEISASLIYHEPLSSVDSSVLSTVDEEKKNHKRKTGSRLKMR